MQHAGGPGAKSKALKFTTMKVASPNIVEAKGALLFLLDI
jgi:hypothetical protein